MCASAPMRSQIGPILQALVCTITFFEGDSPAMSLKSRWHVVLADASRIAADSTVWLVHGRERQQLISALREDDRAYLP